MDRTKPYKEPTHLRPLMRKRGPFDPIDFIVRELFTADSCAGSISIKPCFDNSNRIFQRPWPSVAATLCKAMEHLLLVECETKVSRRRPQSSEMSLKQEELTVLQKDRLEVDQFADSLHCVGVLCFCNPRPLLHNHFSGRGSAWSTAPRRSLPKPGETDRARASSVRDRMPAPPHSSASILELLIALIKSFSFSCCSPNNRIARARLEWHSPVQEMQPG